MADPTREIPATMSPVSVGRIDARLDEIIRDHRVTIPLAIESGSRAWGFPSPDSDYDCRFIYIRSRADYLSLWPPRDVIETPIEGELDVNGWDLGKALRLLTKGNAVVIEWLTSPITYRADAGFRSELLDLANRLADRGRVALHYLHLGEQQRATHFADVKAVAQKKIFYALRPAVALRWLRLHPDAAVAPMHFPTLVAESDMPDDVTSITLDLIARKALGREMSMEPLPPPIGAFIDAEYLAARAAFPSTRIAVSPETAAAADDFFRRHLT